MFNSGEACSEPNMMFYEDRLKTFERWSKQIQPDRKSLAKAGFYYTGYFDRVKCFACGIDVCGWEPTDSPWDEHEKWSSNCVWLKMTGYKDKEESKPQTQPAGFKPTFQPTFQPPAAKPPTGKNEPLKFSFGANSQTGFGSNSQTGFGSNSQTGFGSISQTGANLF